MPLHAQARPTDLPPVLSRFSSSPCLKRRMIGRRPRARPSASSRRTRRAAGHGVPHACRMAGCRASGEGRRGIAVPRPGEIRQQRRDPAARASSTGTAFLSSSVVPNAATRARRLACPPCKAHLGTTTGARVRGACRPTTGRTCSRAVVLGRTSGATSGHARERSGPAGAATTVGGPAVATRAPPATQRAAVWAASSTGAMRTPAGHDHGTQPARWCRVTHAGSVRRPASGGARVAGRPTAGRAGSPAGRWASWAWRRRCA